MEPPEVPASLAKCGRRFRLDIFVTFYSSVVICAALSPAGGRIDALRPAQPLGENIRGMRQGYSSQYWNWYTIPMLLPGSFSGVIP